MTSRRPQLGAHFESNVAGLYIIGDLAGAPVVKLAMQQGAELAEHLASLPDARGQMPLDLLVVGAGAAGLNCALVAREKGLRVVVIEKGMLANTIAEFPEGKWVYAEPEELAVRGNLWLEGATKEELLARWQENVTASGLEVRTQEAVTSIVRLADGFEVRTELANYRARRVVLATGQRGNSRRLGVPGEQGARVHHRLYGVKQHAGESLLVVGGGNSAVEAALALSENNRVVLSYRRTQFHRVFAENRRKLDQAVAAGRIRLLPGSKVQRFDGGLCVMAGGETVAFDHAFVLIGADPPVDFLRSLGVRMENDWGWPRVIWLLLTFFLAYSIYGIKRGPGAEFWPYTGWAYRALSVFDRPVAFWYTVLYTIVMTVFGLRAMKRWGFDKKDRFQVWRYTSLIGFQWLFFFLIPEFLYRWLVSEESWRSYGLVYAWPLFFHTFIGSPHIFWTVWGVVLAFVLIPLLVLFQGKRYCSWICGCGGLAETLGDRWRHLAPKGRASIQWEQMATVVLVAATLCTIWQAAWALDWYGLVVDLWLVGIVPITLYPFLGGKIWCRYWCPLARLMQMMSSFYTRAGVSRFAIEANEKCIACGECTRYCQVGIDVMQFALKQERLDNANSSCIGCGICVTVCPMDTLRFAGKPEQRLVQITVRGAS